MTKVIEVTQYFQGKRETGDHQVIPGVYEIDDPRLWGAGKYLLDTGRAREVDALPDDTEEPSAPPMPIVPDPDELTEAGVLLWAEMHQGRVSPAQWREDMHTVIAAEREGRQRVPVLRDLYRRLGEPFPEEAAEEPEKEPPPLYVAGEVPDPEKMKVSEAMAWVGAASEGMEPGDQDDVRWADLRRFLGLEEARGDAARVTLVNPLRTLILGPLEAETEG